MANHGRLCALLLLVAGAGSLAAQTAPSAAPAQETQNAPAETVVPPAHPATVEQIHELFRLTHSMEIAHKVMDQMVTGMQATSAPYLNQAFWDDLRTSMFKVDIESPSIAAYQKYFSEEDMASVIAFYKTPAGRHLLEAQPLVQAASATELREAGQKVGREVFLRHQKEIEAAQASYEEHIRESQNNATPK